VSINYYNLDYEQMKTEYKKLSNYVVRKLSV